MTDPAPRTIVITGASDGIGAAAARELVERGHRVAVVGRSPEKTRALAEQLGSDAFVADFADFAQVRRLAAELDAAYPVIDVLANNAGGIFGERAPTVDGHEKTLQVNHLAPFLLTQLLLPKLLASGASVLQTSSDAARLAGNIDLDDLDNARRFSAMRAYGDAKLANILFTTELHARYADQGLAAAAFHPGVIATAFGTASTNAFVRLLYKGPVARLLMRTPEQGAAQLVWLAEGTPGTDWESGAYYERGSRARRGHAQAGDALLAAALWERSEELVA